MSVLVNGRDLEKGYGGHSLFQGFDFTVHESDKIGLIGANGAGKSTLLRILARREDPDRGDVVYRSGLKIGFVSQDEQFPKNSRIKDVLYQSLGRNPENTDPETERRVSLGMKEMGIDDQPVSALSGGYRKRLAIISQIVLEPDLLFLDEPTNHLDLAGILWLEELLSRSSFSWVLVSHDRYFLDKTVGSISEIDPLYPKGVLSAAGSYQNFVAKKNEYREGLTAQSQSLSNKLRREEEWLSRGPKARGTKSKSRIEDAHSLRKQVSELKGRLNTREHSIGFSSSERKTKKLIDLVEGKIGRPQQILAEDLDLVVGPGEIIGICGPNGCGKSTLLKTLHQSLPLLGGQLTKAVNLQEVYFDQYRDSLPTDIKVKEALSETGDSVMYQGRSIHVASWAQKFNFSYDQMQMPVEDLSGGEKARLLISRLVRQVADILYLDEPTNDLDISTLEVLEESLDQFKGAILLISHDRALLSRLCDRIIGFLPSSLLGIYASYEQWENEFQKATRPTKKPEPKVNPKPKAKSKSKKLSYMDQREFDQMEAKITEAENHLAHCQEIAEDPAISADASKAQKAFEDLAEAQKNVETLYARWAELESMVE